jgi:hypothetical protein
MRIEAEESNIHMKTTLWLLASAAMLSLANFAHAASDAPQPGCSAPGYRLFDFWVGDWDAYDAEDTTTPAARAHVDLVAAGCAVHELYEQSDGLIGDSILSFDAVRQQWQQTWVTNFGALMVLRGQFNGRTVLLEGEMHFRNGKTALQRITWKPDGSGVRESSEESRDDGKTWSPGFDVIFRKHSSI